MTAPAPLLAHQTAARRRAALDALAIGAPVVLLAAALGWRIFGLPGVLVGMVLGVVGLTAYTLHRIRPLDRGWLIRQLDARLPRFEDSTALLFHDGTRVSGLAALQRTRLLARLPEVSQIDITPEWSRRSIALAWAICAAFILAILAWPDAAQTARTSPSDAATASAAGPPRLTGIRLRITPPAYTGLPVREQTALDARVPQGSRIEWTVGFDPRPLSAALTFPDSVPVALLRGGDRWSAARTLDVPALYRIEAPGLARQRLSRIDVVVDAPPEVRTEDSNSQLLIVRRGQTRWTPVFEATDDYGVQPAAILRITITQGDGENITFLQRTTTLTGTGPARARRFSTTLDLAREGMAAGSDLIVQLVVSDNRSPDRQVVEGPSVILRWPSDLALADGLDGLAAPIMPAYFRSQRQIIIDAEALIAQRRRTAPDQFADRSTAIGNDQAQLRLRYGQFMGEEAEGGGGGLALPTNDAPSGPALPTNDAPRPPTRPAPVEDHTGHGHAEGEHPEEPGSPEAVLAQYGHAHDTGESSTLFDPGTRSTLAQALDAMWGSERALRQGRPEEALPFAYRALELLKQAQQATRIFLPRTGSNLPPIDLSRRLTGKRDGIVADTLARPAPPPVDAVPVQAWRALEERPGSGGTAPLPLDALERWVRENRGRLSDPLALTAAIDTLRNEPGCLACRRRLRALLWTALERPAVTVRRREAPGARGQRYLDALR